MSTVKETLEAEIAKAEAEVAKLKAELEALPEEAHTLETTVWEKIKAFFHAGGSTAPTPPAPPAA